MTWETRWGNHSGPYLANYPALWCLSSPVVRRLVKRLVRAAEHVVGGSAVPTGVARRAAGITAGAALACLTTGNRAHAQRHHCGHRKDNDNIKGIHSCLPHASFKLTRVNYTLLRHTIYRCAEAHEKAQEKGSPWLTTRTCTS